MRHHCIRLSLALLLLSGGIPDRGFAAPDIPAFSAPKSARISLAVVAFKSLTPDPQTNWLQEGLADVLVAQLQQIPQLDITTRSKVSEILKELGFAHTAYVDPATAPQLGKLVAADYILTGSYQVEKGQILLIPQLIEVETGKVVYSETLQESLANKLNLQMTVAEKVMHQFSLKLDTRLHPPQMVIRNEQAWQLYEKGLQQQDKQQWLEAQATYQHALDLEPGFVDAHQHYQEVSQHLKQLPTLLPQYQQWTKAPNAPPVLWNYLGNVHQARGEYPQAEAAYRQVMQQQPRFLPPYLNMGTLAMQGHHDPKAAEQWFQKALAINPLDPYVYFNLGKLHYDLKDHEVAQRYFRKALELSHGKFLVEIQLALYGGTLKIWGAEKTLPGGEKVGEVRIQRQGQPATVVFQIFDDLPPNYDRVTRAKIVASRMKALLFDLVPGNIRPGELNRENVVKTAGDQLIITVSHRAAQRVSLKRDELAGVWANKLAYHLAYEGTSYRTRSGGSDEPPELQALNIGDQLYHEKKYPEALAAYTKALEIKWKLSAAHYARGVIYTDLGDYAKAEKSFDAITDYDPSYIDAYVGLYHLYQKTNHPKEACKVLEEALAADKQNSTVRQLYLRCLE